MLCIPLLKGLWNEISYFANTEQLKLTISKRYKNYFFYTHSFTCKNVSVCLYVTKLVPQTHHGT